MFPGDLLISRSTQVGQGRISTFIVVQQVAVTDDVKRYRLLGIQSIQTYPSVITWSNKGGHMYWNPLCPLNDVK